MKQNRRIIRLAKPKLKGILGIIFSRTLLILLLLAAQALLIVTAFVWFNQYVRYYAAAQVIFAFIMTIYLVNHRMDSSAKLTWLLVISIVPLLGAALLFYTQVEVGHRRMRKNHEAIVRKTCGALPQDEQALAALAQDDPGTASLHRYINRSGCFPVFRDTSSRYLPGGEATFEAMLTDLEQAEKFIFLEYFIIEEGYMWGRILDILSRKAKQGVEVRVLYDGMCELDKLPSDYSQRLESLGIRAKMFSRIYPILSTYYNYRDHRKICIVDGRIAYNGGVNLADEYINKKRLYGHWKDAAVRLEGEAVRSFTLMFLQMWNSSEKAGDTDLSPYLNAAAVQTGGAETALIAADGSGRGAESDGYVMPYCDCPLDEYPVGKNVYIDILARAERFVHIMTPYLILDDELENALKFAAQRGVDVKIILPGVPDKYYAHALARTYYKRLDAAGVRIYEYTPGFVHAKVVSCDGKKAVVGTINFDYRSLYHHFECATYLCQTSCIAEIERDFGQTLARCRAMIPQAIAKIPLLYKIYGAIMKFVAPLL